MWDPIILFLHRFHKGQHIFIDSKEHGQERYIPLKKKNSLWLVLTDTVYLLCSGIISSVGQSEVRVHGCIQMRGRERENMCVLNYLHLPTSTVHIQIHLPILC